MTRLEWTYDERNKCWRAAAGRFGLYAHCSIPGHAYWEVTESIKDPRVTLARCRGVHRDDPSAESLLTAQAAAEEAALSLLVEAVAAFPVERPPTVLIRDVFGGPLRTIDECAGNNPSAAIILGRVLMAAGRAALRARKETDR